MATPVFGFSNKRDGTVVVMDDGSIWQRFSEASGWAWVEHTPLPNTRRANELLLKREEAPRAD